MKRTAFLFLLFLSILSCKKNDPEDQTRTQTDSLFPAGLIRATPAELATIKSITTIDTNQIMPFYRDAESVTIDGMPDANKQIYESCSSWALGYYALSYYYRKIKSSPDLLLSPSFIYN